MSRFLARLGALVLSGAALAACASAPDSSTAIGRDLAIKDQASAPGTTLDGEIRSAQLQRTQGDLPGAIRTLSQLMLAAPDDPRVVGEYGKVLTQQGRSTDAVQFLTRAVQLQPSDWTLYSALGVAYDQTGDAANARVAYDRALSLKPDEAVVLNNYAMSRMLAGDLTQAHRLILRAAATGSADPKIARNLALLDGLAAESAPSSAATSAVAGASPQPTPQAEIVTTGLPPASESVALHAPKPLFTASSNASEPRTIVMQEVPFDAKAGPVGKAKKLAATKHKLPKLAAPKLRKLVAAPAMPKLAAAPALRTTIVPPAKSTTASKSKIPALRLADDHS